jgi:hypothetical protein
MPEQVGEQTYFNQKQLDDQDDWLKWHNAVSIPLILNVEMFYLPKSK